MTSLKRETKRLLSIKVAVETESGLWRIVLWGWFGEGYPFFLLGSLSNDNRDGNKNVKKAIDYFRIPHNTFRLLPQILQRLLFSNALEKMQYSQEHLKTIWGANRDYYGGFENRE